MKLFLRVSSDCDVCQFTCGTPKLQARAGCFYIYNWGGASLPRACDRDTVLVWGGRLREGEISERDA